MSNLSELLPTGGGQNAVDFVASGTLSSGQTVALRSDGKVEAVSGTAATASVGSLAVASSTIGGQYLDAAYDSTNQKLFLAFENDVSTYGTGVVGTISGTTITFGTPVVFVSAQTKYTSVAYDSNADKFVVVWADTSSADYGRSRVATVTGTSISYGSQQTWTSSGAGTAYNRIVYDNATQNVIVFTKSSKGYAFVGTVSGTSVSWGISQGPFEDGGPNYIYAAYDTTSGKYLITYQDSNNSNYGTAVVGTLSGTTITFGTPVVFNSATTYIPSLDYSSTSGKFLIAYRDGGDTNKGNCVLATISGTSVSFGSEYQYTSGSIANWNSVAYDPDSNTFLIAWYNTVDVRGYYLQAEVSGATITFGSTTAYPPDADYPNGYAGYNTNAVYLGSGRVSVSSSTMSTLTIKSFIKQNAYVDSNYADFIGITAEAISDTATGAVNVYGGINEAQTGLTIGSDYYVQADGSLSTTASAVKAGQAISATTINMMDLT